MSIAELLRDDLIASIDEDKQEYYLTEDYKTLVTILGHILTREDNKVNGEVLELIGDFIDILRICIEDKLQQKVSDIGYDISKHIGKYEIDNSQL